jgi:hypothetical protein
MEAIGWFYVPLATILFTGTTESGIMGREFTYRLSLHLGKETKY